MTENEMVDVTKEVAKEISKDVYNDAGKPIAKPAGELLGLVPRAIKAALSPVEKWVLQKEYNIEETKRLLEQKLEGISPDLIESPDPHIAVPALQYISYCMDNDELRDMYANLLANSMNKVVKKGVHPGFVEIIKQLSPDEARLLKQFKIETIVPTITVRLKNEEGYGINSVKNFTNIGEKANCEQKMDLNNYFDNLIRLGLLEKAEMFLRLKPEEYDALKRHPYIVSKISKMNLSKIEYKTIDYIYSYIAITDFGKTFCEICISDDM
jgi:hypothetical protein